MQETIQEASKLILESDFCIALTGAGISVDSGIPDFRSPGGLWDRFDPMEYAHIDSFRINPHKIWNMLIEMNGLIGDAKPNAGHLSLAALEEINRLRAIITQNIDNLHQDAGNSEVIEFHGNAKRFRCIWCDHTYSNAETMELGMPPQCACGKILKPDVIFFGETIPEDALHKSMILAQKADLMLLLGTSAQVAPANLLPSLCLSKGGKIIEINLEPTHLSHERGVVSLRGSTTEILPKLLGELRAQLQ